MNYKTDPGESKAHINAVEDELRADIERLRKDYADKVVAYGEAADIVDRQDAEIERLTAIAETDTPELELQWQEIKQLRAEIERLRATLDITIFALEDAATIVERTNKDLAAVIMTQVAKSKKVIAHEQNATKK